MRKPPHSVNDERALIGAAIITGRYGEINLEPSEFFIDFYARVWAYIRDKAEIDQVALESEFIDERQMLTDAVNATPAMVNMPKIAGRIKANAHKRRVIQSLTKAVDGLYDGMPVESVSGEVVKSMDGVGKSDWVPLGEVLPETYKSIESAQTNNENVNFMPSGFRDFDSEFGGLQKEGLIVVAGRPSMGKTAMASAIALECDKDVLIMSMEMQRNQIAMRFFAARAGVSLKRMGSGTMTPEDWSKLSASLAGLMDAGIYINDTTGRTIADVEAEARRFSRTKNAGLIIIDYLTLLSMPESYSKNEAVSEVTRRLKCLAGEIHCPIILLSQLNRDLEKRKNKRPIMSDLRDSGAIEQDADQIIFPYRPEVYENDPKWQGVAIIDMAKNRNGSVGAIQMTWVAEQTAFKDMASFDD